MSAFWEYEEDARRTSLLELIKDLMVLVDGRTEDYPTNVPHGNRNYVLKNRYGAWADLICSQYVHSPCPTV